MRISSLALYFEPSQIVVQGNEFAVCLLDFCESYGAFFETANVLGEALSSSKMHRWPDIKGLVMEELAAGRVSRLDLYSMNEGFKQYEFGWNGMMSIDFRKGVVFVGISQQNVSDLKQYAVDATRCAAKAFSVEYGYAYCREMSKGPYLYAIGIVAGLDINSEADDEEADEITAWHDEIAGSKAYLKQKLRDVYPINVLSASHLKTIEGCQHGSISPIDDGQNRLYIWQIDEGDLQQAKVKLRHRGLLIC